MAKTYTVTFGTGDPRTWTGLTPTLLIFANVSSGTTLVAPAFSEALTGSGIYKFAYGTTTPIGFLADAATTGPGAVGRYVYGQLDPVDRMDEVGTSLIALGTTTVALGTTTVAIGTTAVAIGTSGIALGTTSVALGTTLIGFGTSQIAQGVLVLAGQTILGTSLIAIGVTQLAQGTLITQTDTDVLNLGTSFVAFGVSSIALGNTILAASGAGSSLSILIGSTASAIGDSVTDPSTLFGYVKRLNESILGQETFNKGSGAFIILDRTGATTLASRTITNSASMVIKS